MSTPLVEAVNVKKYFKTPRGLLHAVEDVNFKIFEGKTLGVVGESGCGKSTLGRTILRLHEATSGQVLYNGENILEYKKREMHKVQRNMQMIFQDPYSSLDPRMSVRALIMEPLEVVGTGEKLSKAEKREKADRIMELCGLPSNHANLYPHELDGGLRQRVGLARAMILEPKFLVCDEPVSALDVSIQAQILNLLMDLQDNKGLSYMFITHDLAVVKHISDQIMVMYMGQVIELATSDELFKRPLHPYTRALLNAIPTIDLSRRNREKVTLKGEVTSPINPEPGCRFAKRCPFASEKCKQDPVLKEVAPGHFATCTMGAK
ncbi:ABC transporter ATP-binding protein [Bullifex porci]|uniref:ABC transporter ATP-binding protein n=1 Tax=Bullifex porci TaxID=2606638 RepID=UPI0023F12D03|nr:oligopeptide/dipeptide ABC transporter ATP-binding protein [Bullifex porci]MDD7256341.1 ATP-binding cassette domain-containing protein [Bullifex porci]MDD7589398.1 ATP-binding cassette domain-containing protein [Bullifex porci]MDY2741421.1 oligopeptide/dipeptide ABC transporter ATP-binding protein [Bullifex porci]